MTRGGIFHGRRILCTALRPSERAQLHHAIQTHGGELLTGPLSCDDPDIVVTRCARSPKLDLLSKRRLPFDAVLPSWVLQSVEAGKALPTSQFRLKPLAGLNVCLSGFSRERKDALAAMLAEGGAQHSSALDKRCTHLVATTTTSDKYRCATCGAHTGRPGPGVRGPWSLIPPSEALGSPCLPHGSCEVALAGAGRDGHGLFHSVAAMLHLYLSLPLAPPGAVRTAPRLSQTWCGGVPHPGSSR